MVIIGLTGMAGCGKDTVADFLVREHDYRRIAFADPLRKMVYDLDPIVDLVASEPRYLQEIVDEMGWDAAKRTFPEVRRVLQRFGTEVVRNNFGPDYWVDRAMNTIRDAPHDTKWVITDCRFENEAQAIRDIAGDVVKIERPGLEALPGGHASETGFPEDLLSGTLLNRGTIQDLEESVSYMVGFLGK